MTKKRCLIPQVPNDLLTEKQGDSTEYEQSNGEESDDGNEDASAAAAAAAAATGVVGVGSGGAAAPLTPRPDATVAPGAFDTEAS